MRQIWRANDNLTDLPRHQHYREPNSWPVYPVWDAVKDCSEMMHLLRMLYSVPDEDSVERFERMEKELSTNRKEPAVEQEGLGGSDG